MITFSFSLMSLATGPSPDSFNSSKKKKVRGMANSLEILLRKDRLGSLFPFSTK